RPRAPPRRESSSRRPPCPRAEASGRRGPFERSRVSLREMNMYRIVSARTGLIVSTLFVCVGIASSCTVDTDGLVFEDVDSSGGLGGDTGQSHFGGLGGDGGDGGAMSVGCEHGAMDCDGKQVEICAGGEWYPAGEACEFVCVAGLCVGSCDPGS